MGYRQYFYEVDKSLIDDIRQCSTEEDLYNVYIKNGLVCDKDVYDGEVSYYCPLYKLGKEIFEFGKCYENSSNIYKCGDSLFTTDVLNERYEEYRPIICTEDAILCAVEWQKNHIISIYEHLVNNTFECVTDRFLYPREMDDKEVHYKRLLSHCQDHLRWWNPEFGDYSAISMDKDNDNLVTSWLYEHTIFDLIRIYKTFDWENKCLLFMGW